VYASQRSVSQNDDTQHFLQEIDTEYTRHPFYSSRHMVAYLRRRGYCVNRKCVQRLMSLLGLAGMASSPATSRLHPQHKVYPYQPFLSFLKFI
jgi:putative transposase